MIVRHFEEDLVGNLGPDLVPVGLRVRQQLPVHHPPVLVCKRIRQFSWNQNENSLVLHSVPAYLIKKLRYLPRYLSKPTYLPKKSSR